MSDFLRFENVSFSYPGQLEMLLENVNAHFASGWTGIVGANGCGKSTLLKLASGDLEPVSGKIHQVGTAQYVVQRTDFPPEQWEDFLDSADYEAAELRRTLRIDPSWGKRWDSLSHGERKRTQIAVALWKAPDLLALDEPTNHIDAEARKWLIQALQEFCGVGLLVSHDRELLDALCDQCLFLFPPNATMRPGGVTEGMEQDRQEQETIRSKDEDTRHTASRLRASAQQSRELAERQAAKNKTLKNRQAPLHDHDGRFDRRMAKLTGKDGWATKQSSALASRAGKLENSRNGLSNGLRKEYDLGISLAFAGCSPRNSVLHVPAGQLPLGEGRTLQFPELNISPTDRIALTGPNGFGKSTLLKYLLPKVNVPPEKLIYIPQEISATESQRILKEVQELPHELLGKVMTCVSCLGSRPGRLLESELSSPGEIRKILLALGVSRGPHLIIMDEPTNHLDLPSITCLEDALDDCPCAILLVSHDERFLQKLARRRWALTANSPALVTLTPNARL